jgi:putative SOS response-associated peptidase YedK
MCGRYRLTAKERYLRDHFGLDGDLSWAPRWNIAPTQQVPVVRQDRKEPKRTFALLRWGLIPFWTLLAKCHMIRWPSWLSAEMRVGAGRIPLQ